MRHKVREEIAFSCEKVTKDGDKHFIKDVLLLGSISKNTYEGKPKRYSESTMKEALPKFDNIQINANHSMPRSILETIGVGKNPRIIEGKVFGDLEIIDSEAGRHVALLAKNFPNVAGMSIVGDGNVEVGEEYADITNLTPYSVDAVSNPATTKGFFESMTFNTYTGFGSLNLALDYERMTKEDLLKEIAKFIQFISAVGEVCKSLPEGKTKEDVTFEAVKNIPQGFYKAYRNLGKGK